MQGNGMFIRLFQRLVEQIIEGDIDQVRSIISRNAIQPQMRNSFNDLLQVIEQLKQANQSYMNDISFYRTIIKRLEKGGDIPKQELIDREDISPDKLQEVVKFVGKVSEIRAQSSIFPNMEVEKKIAKDRQFEMEIKMTQMQSNLKEMEDLHRGMRMSSQQQIDQKRQEILRLKEEIERLDAACENRTKVIEQLENQKEDFQKAVKELTITLISREKEIEECKVMLQEKDAVIVKLKKEIDTMNAKIADIEDALCISNQNSQRTSQILLDLQDTVNISRKENEILKQEKAAIKPLAEVKMSLHFEHSLRLKPAHSEAIIQALQAELGEIRGLETLFRFKTQKSANFHQFVDGKSNLLLVCLTENDQIVGAFTSAGLTLKNEPQETKAFLLQSQGDSINTFKLKAGLRSTEYDADFILFGREELCIERGSLEMSSSLMNGRSAQFHYLVSRQHCRDFLVGHSEDKVALQDYELLIVQF